jgi:hypothetical protein
MTSESRQRVVQIGQRMLQAGYFAHVVNEHAFEDEFLFYRFASDVDVECLNKARIYQGEISLPPDAILTEDESGNAAVELSAYLLRSIIKIYESNVSEVTKMDTKRILESSEFAQFSQLVTQLQVVDLTPLGSSARLPFWLNIFHTLILHATLKVGIQASALRPLEFYRCSYAIGSASGSDFSLMDIEHTMLRGKLSKPSGWGGQMLVPLFVRLSSKNNRKDWRVLDGDARLNFALSHLAASSPPIRIYTDTNILTALQAQTQNFLEKQIFVDPASRRIVLPEILKWYMNDFSPESNSKRQLAYKIMLSMRMGGKREQMRTVLTDFATAQVSFETFDWRFVFSVLVD